MRVAIAVAGATCGVAKSKTSIVGIMIAADGHKDYRLQFVVRQV